MTANDFDSVSKWRSIFESYFREEENAATQTSTTGGEQDAKDNVVSVNQLATGSSSGPKLVSQPDNSSNSPSTQTQEDYNEYKCKWDRCRFETDTLALFYDHVNDKHVYNNQSIKPATARPIKSKKKFRCKWRNCRMFSSDMPSLERLAKHVRNSHTKEKAFRCRMQSCTFETNFVAQLMKHMDSHDKRKTSCNSKNEQSSARKISSQTNKETSSGGSSCKSRRGASKALANTTAKYPPNPDSYIESKKMLNSLRIPSLCLMQNKLKLALKQLNDFIEIDPTGYPNCVGLYGHVIASRRNHNTNTAMAVPPNECQELLIRWVPEGIADDEWISNENVKPLYKIVHISKLPPTFFSNNFPWLDFNRNYSKKRVKSIPKKFTNI